MLPPAPPGGVGSNAWVVDPARSTTGGALLANDPHLHLQAPGVWYLAHLETPELALVGATLPGIPAVVLGHNGSIAWGFTNTGADTQDLFIERVDPEDPARYLTPGGSAPFAVREEVIEVAGDAPVALSVRATRHGPVLSDLLPDAAARFGADHVVALAWSAPAEDDLAIQALLGIDRARDWTGFVAALRDVGAPMQNILYADASGHIGFIAPGRVPIRKHGDGRWPVPGWTGEYDWTGWVPFDALPRALDPPGGVLFNANNRIVPPDYPYLLTADWEAPYRARRLAELLERAAIGAGGVRGDAGGSAVAARAGSAADHARGQAERSGGGRRDGQAQGLGPGDARGRRRAPDLRCVVPRAVASDLCGRDGRPVPRLLARAPAVHGAGPEQPPGLVR